MPIFRIALKGIEKQSDKMTGWLNRDYFMEKGDALLKKGKSLAFVYIDLENLS
jgi:GGDEF domain-containing protein